MGSYNDIVLDRREVHVLDQVACCNGHEAFLDLAHVRAKSNTGVGRVGDLRAPNETGE